MNQENYDKQSLAAPYRYAVLTLLILLAGALVLYRQRMLFVDPSWISFNIMNTGRFSIPENRYGAFITQLFPLLATYLGLPLKAVLVLYSVSFYLFYTTVAIVAGRCRQYGLGILLAFYFTLMVSDVYFWPSNEVHQGVGWMVLFLAFFFKKFRDERPTRFYLQLPMAVFVFLAVFSHFIVILPLTFLWMYLRLQQRPAGTGKGRLYAGYSLLIVLLIFVKYRLSAESWYDGAKLAPVKHLSVSAVMGTFASGQARSILFLVLHNYWLLIPVFSCGLAALIYQRRYVQALLTTAYCLGYFVLICLTYPAAFGRELLFYMESEWMAWSLIIATPFVFNFLPLLKTKQAVAVTVFIFAIRFYYLHGSYEFFQARYRTLERFTDGLSRHGIRNAVIRMDAGRRQQLFIMDWGLPVESMMLSGLKGDTLQTTFKIVGADYPWRPARDSFYSDFSIHPYRILNRRYFQPDTAAGYRLLQEEDLNRMGIR